LYRFMVVEAASQIQTAMRTNSESYATARRHVESMYRLGELTEDDVLAFAQARKFDETTIALSLLGDLPSSHVERARGERHPEHILVIGGALDLSWDTTRQILLMRTRKKADPAHELEAHHAIFLKLQASTAKSAMQFYRLRTRSVAAPASL